ncbi:MobF family relaxase [Geomonas oryzae]|uniref:MobF family relaxase n=1 Tax=Geomonas oryzae TaxID=2364273 RepID=UPI002482AAE1|nr:MobF family relaxase [Geomonas oryzae]
MSVSPGMSASQAGGYFSREDYYLKGADQGEHSRWLGRGADSLKLAGQVREEEFRALCAGRDPTSRERIVAPKLVRDKKTGELVEIRRAGNDCTFSAPKSVSILYAAGSEGIKEAHDAAVAAVLGHAEERYSFYRCHGEVVRGEMVAAVFDHATSRSLDPQLHSHVFIVNAVRTVNGDWKGNRNRTLFQDQKLLGRLYRQELVHELEQRGYGIVFTSRSKMFFEVAGVDPQLIEHFSSRRKAIEQQVRLWNEGGKFPGVPHARLFEMAALETRDPKREVTRQDVVEAFEQGFNRCGTTSFEVKEKLERSRGCPVPPGHSAPEVVRLAADRLVEREAVLERARLLDRAVEISGGRHGIEELNRALEEGVRDVMRLGRDGRGREYYTTREMQELEARNLETVRTLPGFRSVTTFDEVAAYLRHQEETGGVRLSAGQKEQVVNELAGSRSVSVVEGKAGTGKTLASQVIEEFNREVLEPQGKEHRTFNVAYTAKAASEMEKACGRPGWTVDAFLNARARGEVRLQRQDEAVPMLVVAGERVELSRGTQVVLRVDEAGMLGARQAGLLLDTVRELQGEGVQVKLQLIGDPRQMPAIAAGDLFRQVLKLSEEGAADVAHLDEIRRQKDPGLLEIAKVLNREDRLPGENAREALDSLKETGRVIEREGREALLAEAVREYRAQAARLSPDAAKAALGERQSVLLVAATNADREELNRAIRESRVAAGEIEPGRSFKVLVPATTGVTADSYREGEVVVFSGYRGVDGRMERWGARLNTVGKVTGIDPEGNRVEVAYSFKGKARSGAEAVRNVTKKLPAAEMAGRVTVYREEERIFAPGDRLVTLKNDWEHGVRNGSLGVVERFDETGQPVVRFETGEVTLDLARYRHIDHAYAVTLHKSQGSTVEHAILFAPVRPGGEKNQVPAEGYARASYNALNVAVTRARYGATVCTNSLSDLAREVERVEVKTSTLYPIQHAEERGPVVAGDGMVNVERKIPEAGSFPAPADTEPLSRTGEVLPQHPVSAKGEPTVPVPARERFDRGAKFSERLDALARAGAARPPEPLVPKVVGAVIPVKTIEPVKSIPVKGMDIDM